MTTYHCRIEKHGHLTYSYRVTKEGKYLYASGFTFTKWGAKSRIKHYIFSQRPKTAQTVWEYQETESEEHPLWAADGGKRIHRITKDLAIMGACLIPYALFTYLALKVVIP